MPAAGAFTTPAALVVMARHPEPGKVKTRLAREIGVAAAAEVYRAFLSDIRRRFVDPDWSLLWAFEPAAAPFAAEFAGGAEAFPQVGGDLGERMAGAIAETLRRGFDPVVLIGSDVPHLPLDHVRAAFAALREPAALVLGPTEDGGYCLIGCRRVPPVFASVEWGGERVLAETLARAERAGLAPRLLPKSYDIDLIGDLERLAREIAGGIRGLDATQGALARLGLLAL